MGCDCARTIPQWILSTVNFIILVSANGFLLFLNYLQAVHQEFLASTSSGVLPGPLRLFKHAVVLSFIMYSECSGSESGSADPYL